MVQSELLMIKEQFLSWSFNIIISFILLIIILFLVKMWMDREIKRQVEESRLHFQENRLIAMGDLLENIAHHWKQPLNSISLMALNIQKQSDRGDLTSTYLEEKLFDIEEVVEEMSKTIEEFHTYLIPTKNRELFSINRTVKVSIKILSSLLKKHNIEITFIEQGNYKYNGYKNELLQALLIILTNAKDSLLKNEELKEKRIIVKLFHNEKGVNISIQDNSFGVLNENIHRVFDPYFTTSHKTKGKGLGLYIAKMIIVEHFNGSISVYNKDGAIFNISFSI